MSSNRFPMSTFSRYLFPRLRIRSSRGPHPKVTGEGHLSRLSRIKGVFTTTVVCVS